MTAKPTEPGWYWLADAMGLDWEIVHVWLEGEDVWFARTGDDSSFRADSWISANQWGGRITQEPVTDPPLPF